MSDAGTPRYRSGSAGALALMLTPLSLGALPLTMGLLIVARTSVKAYQPAF